MDIVKDSIELDITSHELTQKTNEVVVSADTALEIRGLKKEYSIVGDSLYAGVSSDSPPQWLANIIDNVVNALIGQKLTALDTAMNSINAILRELDIAKNQYQQLINIEETIDGVLVSKLETLNATVQQNSASIIDLDIVKTTADEALAITINHLNSEINNGEISSLITRLNATIANNELAAAKSINQLESVYNENESMVREILSSETGVYSVEDNAIVNLVQNVTLLQKQTDGLINTYVNTYDVMLGIEDPNNNTDNDQLVTTAEPYVSWMAEDTASGNENVRLAHIGDVYIKYNLNSNGTKEYIASYKFIKTVTDSTSPYSTDADGFTWALIIDQAAQDAYVAALNAYDLADGKRRVYVGLGAITTPKTPYDQGDLWLIDYERVVNGYQCKVGDILRCIETKGSIGTYEQNDWVLASSYANAVDAQNQLFQDFVNNDYATFVSDIQNQVDGKAETFYQNSVPTGRIKLLNVPDNAVLNKYIGDLWKNTYAGTISGYLGDNTEYIYTKKANGANWDYDWTKMEVPDIVFDTIDTKKSIYRGNSVPVAIAPDVIEVNDMWITGDNPVSPYVAKSIYVWNGTAWLIPVRYTDDTATVALQNGLADGTVTVKLTNAYVGTTPFLTYLTSEMDSKVGVYSGETAPVAGQPSGVAANDIYLWFTTASKVLANGTTQVYDITRTYKYSGSVWNEITTDSNITALADLADGKRTVFSGNTVPVGAVNRDIWIPSATNGVYLQGEIYQYNGTAWIVATKYSANIEAVRSNLQSQVDGKVETYYQATVPVGMTAVNNGDYWYCTADVSTYKKGKVYKYVHATTSWVETADVSRYAFDTADGKAAVFLSNNLPTAGYKVNDMLIVIGSFNNGTTAFSDGVVLSSNSTRTSGFTPSDWVKKINDTEDLDAFVSTTYTPTITNLQNQVDAKTESWYTVSASDPKTAWTDSATRLKHNGDLWYQTDTKLSYYYSSSTNSWNLIDDAKAIQALADAANAQETADGKITTFYQSTNPVAEGIGDLWVDSDNNNKLHRWNGSSWEYLRDTTKDAEIAQALANAQNAQDTADGKIESFYQTTAPIVASEGDIWFDTDDGNKIYTYRSGVWTNTQDSKIGQALLDAAYAQATADGKIVTFYQPTAPVAEGVGDIWIDSDDGNKMYRWNGSSWGTDLVSVMVAKASAVTELSTELSNGTNTWAAADSRVTNSLVTKIANDVASVESKWEYNSVVGINGVYKRSGFGLTTNYSGGSGTKVDPYTSEFWIDATKLKFTNSAATGRTAPFTIDASGVTPQITFNGKVSFSNVTGAPSGGSNLLYNSAPMLGNETKGWNIGWYNTGIVPVIGVGFEPDRPSGGGSVFARVPGAPAINGLFDLTQTALVPVISGKWYEASAYIGSHRCISYVGISWYDSNNVYINEIAGTQIAYQSNGALANWRRSTLLAQAPSNAAKAQFYVRSAVSGTDPHCFVAFAYLGQAVQGQAVFSDWSEGTSAGVSSGEVVNDINNGNTTTINGGRITTGSITANQIAANSISADRISSYNLTSTNAAFENGIITNAKIANAAIDNSKIGDLSVSTLKIQDEAVVVPRSASGGYSCTIYYTPNVSHAVTVLGEWVQGSGRDGVATCIAINGVDVRAETPKAGTLCSMFYNTYFYAGTPYAITLYTVANTGHMSCRLLMLGTKK